MKKKRLLLLLLCLSLVLVASIGMVACSERPNQSGGDDEPEEPPIEENYDVNFYLAKINSGLNGTIEKMENETSPLKEYAVQSEYTFKTGEENYTMRFDAVYGANQEKNKYYLRLFDNVNHIDRATIYYDSTDLYIYSDNGRYKVSNFNSLLLYELFCHLMNKVDLYKLFYGELMTSYFRRGSLLTNAFRASDCVYNLVGSRGEAISFRNGDFSILISTLNARIEAMTEGIGTSFDALTYNMLGFKLSRLIEYSFNSINVEYFRFLLDGGNVYDTSASIKGRMLNGSDYFIYANYKYDEQQKTIEAGEEIKRKYVYSALTPGTGSFEGQISLPTVREEPYLASFDYDLNSKDNALNNFTFRIYDQKSTETEVKDKYANISEFLSVYYTNEIMYVNAEGLCHFVGTPVELESLHLPKVYFADMDICSVMQAGYNYIIRIIDVLTDPTKRTETRADKELFEALMEAISSPDLQTLQVEVTEELIKNIRGDDTSMTVLVSRWLTGKDEALANVIPNDFFQLLTVLLSYKFIENGEDNIILEGIYDGEEYFEGVFYRVPYAGISLPKDLNDIYYTLFEQPEVVTLDYDVNLTPYRVSAIDASKFFGIFVGDGSGRNTPCVISSGENLVVRGKVSESYNVNAAGERVTITTVHLTFYKKTATSEETLMTVTTNPADSDEILIAYYGPVGAEGMRVSGGLKYRIGAATIKNEMEKLTDENNIFLSESNFAILLGLLSSLGGNSETYVRDNRYVVSVMATDTKDPVADLIGISDTFAIFRVKVAFSRIDLSSVSARDYSTPYIEEPENVTIRSIYTDNSKWKETIPSYVSGLAVEMYLTYTDESIKIETGKNEYYPTAYLFGKEVRYRVSILDTVGTYLISDLLTGNNTITFSYAYQMLSADVTKGAAASYLLVIDPAYTKVLPKTVDVRYDNYEVGSINCSVEGFSESTITRDGYNLPLLAGDYQASIGTYTLRIGKNSIQSYIFSIYVAVLNRNVISVKKNGTSSGAETIAYINNVKQAEKIMAREVDNGTEQITVINRKNVPIVGEIEVDPYTYAMMNISIDNYSLVSSYVGEEQMRIWFYGFYGTGIEKDEETSVEIEYNKYYNKEGYNYINLSERIERWNFDETLISWQGGVYFATAVFGSEEGFSIPIAIRIIVKKSVVQEVCIDDESNSIYTIDYLIKSTYTIPTTSTAGHKVDVVFKDDKGTTARRHLIPTRLGSLSDREYYEEYLLGSLNWAGTENLATRITEEGTSSLFGSGQNATSVTTAVFGSGLGIGTQEVSLNVLQPSRRQSGEDEKSCYLVKQYTVSEENERTLVTPQYGHVSISKAKFTKNSDAYDCYEINPYDFTAALPETVWLFVNHDSVTKEWKEYAVNWQTTDRDGNELNLIKEKGGRYVLAYPSTELRDLVVYGCIGDGNGVIWVRMIARNLYSELQSIRFYAYSYEEQTVSPGMALPVDRVYYEYYVNGYAITEDVVANANKEYFTKKDQYVVASVTSNESVEGDYYEYSGGSYVLTSDTVFRSGKTYYVRRTDYVRASVLAGSSLAGETYYEHVENAYGITGDNVFSANKKYYLYIEKEIDPNSDYLFVDPYADYDEVIPKEYDAVLGSGARVSSRDVDDEGNVTGLVWYAVIDNEEYPLIRSGRFLSNTQDYNKRYDEQGKFIFPWNSGAIGLKCYIKGSGDIFNEAMLNLNVRSRALYTTTDESGVKVGYIDVYNGDDPFAGIEETQNKGIYSGKVTAGFVEVDCYDATSSALLARLRLMRELQNAGKKVYIGVRFSSVNNLYSLPVVWDIDILDKMILSLTSANNLQGQLYLTGTICTGTVNEQKLYLPFSVKEAVLTAVKPNYASTMIQQNVYEIVNDDNKNERLESEELNRVREYSFVEQYLAYIGSQNISDTYSAIEYSNIIYFDITKAYALTNNREGYFCTPYDYLTYLFNGLVLCFQGGAEIQATAGDQLKLIGTGYVDPDKADAQERLKDYFNRSVLGLLNGTTGGNTVFVEDEIRYSYSFIALNKFSQGSAVSRSLIAIRAAVSEYGVSGDEIIMEPYNRDLTQAYGTEGFPLPSYEGVNYSTDDGTTYNVRYGIPKWTESSSQSVLNGNGKNIILEGINVTNGASYEFHYELPCSQVSFNLSVKIPQKNMGTMGYGSASDELYPIVNGEIEIDNAFAFIYYDRTLNDGAGGYAINENNIPSVIIANVTSEGENVYTATNINSYEINWTFHYNDRKENGKRVLDSELFTEGGRFCLATCDYFGYYDNDGIKIERQLRLYVNVAKLTYYGVTDLEGVSVTGTTTENGVLLNNVEIDPYANSVEDVYVIPGRITVLFNSETNLGEKVMHTFSQVEYNFSSRYGDLQNMVVARIPYNKDGHELGAQYPAVADVSGQTVYLTMSLYLGDGSLLGVYPVQITVLARKIDKARVYNTVYKDGLSKGYGTFTAAEVPMGAKVPADTYYEYDGSVYFLTSDAEFRSDKTYYTKKNSFLFVESIVQNGVEITSNTYYEFDGNRFVLTEDTVFDDSKVYYTRVVSEDQGSDGATAYVYMRQNVRVDDDVPLNTYYVNNGSGYVLTTDTVFREGVVYYVRKNSLFYNSESYYEAAETVDANGVYYELVKATTKEGDLVSPTYYAYGEVDGTFAYYPEATYYYVTARGEVRQGRAYYTVVRAAVKVGDPIPFGSYYKEDIGQDLSRIYVAARGKFVANVSYYTLTPVELKIGSVLSGVYYEKAYYTFGTSAQRFVPKPADDGEYIRVVEKATGNVRYERNLSSSEQKYVMQEVNMPADYRLAEKYYVYTAGRYEETTDAVFSKTTPYYIFREASDTSTLKRYYKYFEGYEGESFHSEASVVESGEDERGNYGVLSRAELPVYYVDPYNASTFRLPTEIYLKFTTTDDFRSYPIRGWKAYDKTTGVLTEFTRYTSDPNGANPDIGLSYYSAATPDRFYEIPSTSGAYLGYFMPQSNDFGGGTYRVCGYIKVGKEEQYFDMLIVVLNRSLKINEELGHSYSLIYDYDDPVGALLSDISAVMREEMFVAYDSYYLSGSETNTFGQKTVDLEYRVENSAAFDYRNGNAPIVPTIVWKESWQYDNEGYSFNSVSLTGYDGEIYGNVFAEDKNIENLYNRYYDIVFKQYQTLIKSWMWDIVTTEDYSGQTTEKIDSLKNKLREDVVVRGYDTLCSLYRINSSDEDITRQMYYSYITGDYYQELLRELQGTAQGKDYTSVGNKKEIVLYMFDKIETEYREWEANGSVQSRRNLRMEIFEDWEESIAGYEVQIFLPSTDNDVITGEVNDYVKLKAAYYDLISDESANNFLTAEKKFNKSYYDRYQRKIASCVMRDVWNKVFEYANIVEKSTMQSLVGEYSGTDTYKKSSALADFMKKKEELGISGEEASGHISIPVLNYEKMLDNEGHESTVIYFNPFDFTTIDKEFNLEFTLDYSEIYRKKMAEAEKDIESQHRDEYADVSLEELRNMLAEKGIDAIAPIVSNGNGTFTNQLSFTIGGRTYDFTYQNYIDTLRDLYSGYDASTDTSLFSWEKLYDYLAGKGSNTLFKLNKELWEALYNYYEELSLQFMNSNITGEATAAKWNNLRNLYVQASLFAADEGREEYAEYYAAVKVKMDELTDDMAGLDYADLLPDLRSFIQNNYPAVVAMDAIYNSRENITAVYASLAEGMLKETADNNIYSNVHLAYNSDEKQAIRMVFGDIFDDFIAGINVQSLINKLEDKYKRDSGNDVYFSQYDSMKNDGAYSGYWNVRSAYRAQSAPLYYMVSGDSYSTLSNISREIIEFVRQYVVNNNFVTIDAESGKEIVLKDMYYEFDGNGYVETEDDYFLKGKTYYVRSTPFGALLLHAEEFGFTGEDIENGVVLLRGSNDDEYRYFANTFRTKLPSDAYQNYLINFNELSAVGVSSAAKMCDEFASYLFYNRFYAMLNRGSSESRRKAELLAGYASDALTNVKALMLRKLIEANEEGVSSDDQTAQLWSVTVLNKLNDYFGDYVSGVNCLSARAFMLLMKKQEKESKGSFDEDYAEKEEKFTEGIFYGEAKGILDTLIRDWPTVYGVADLSNVGDDGDFNSTLYILNRIYRLFMWKRTNGNAVPGYTLAHDAETDLDYPEAFRSDPITEKDVLSCDEYFRYKAEQDGYYFADYETAVTFYKDYALRAILYFYERVANDSQRQVVEEVAGIYAGKPFTADQCVERMKGGNVIDSKSFFIALLRRHDLGEGAAEKLYNSYYALYLEEGYAMLSYVTKYGKIIESTTGMYASAKNEVEEFASAVLGGRSGAWSEAEEELLFGEKEAGVLIEDGILQRYYRMKMRPYVLDAIQGKSLFATLIGNKKAELKKYFIPEAYGIYYNSGYSTELDEILNFIVSADSSDPRYDRVNDILRSVGKTYPNVTDINKDLFYVMTENMVEEELQQFFEAVGKGVVKSLYEELYETLFLFTVSSEEFARFMYYYITSSYATGDLLQVVNEVVGNEEVLARKTEYRERLRNKWWTTEQFKQAACEYFGLSSFELSENERKLIEAVYDQQYYFKDGNQTNAALSLPLAVYSFLSRFEERRDGNGEGSMDRGALTEKNILNNDYSETTIDYKFYFIDTLMNDSSFMRGYEHNGELRGSVTLLQSELQSIFRTFIEEKKEVFATASSLTTEQKNDMTAFDLIIYSLTRVGFTASQSEHRAEYEQFSSYLQNVVDVLSHTSVYVNMDLGAVNPLLSYVENVYRKVIGIRMTELSVDRIETSSIGGDPSKLGQLPLGYFVNNYKAMGYDAVLAALLESRTVRMTFYSEDHLTKDSAEEELRHVVYLDSGRSAGWAEYVPTEGGEKVSNTLSNVRVYFANSRKTVENIEVRDIRYYTEYIDKYINDFTKYTVRENKENGSTVILFAGGYLTNDISFELNDLTSIKVYFDGSVDANTLMIDVLDPKLPDKVRAEGYIGQRKVSDLGYITDFSFSDILYRLPFDVDMSLDAETRKKYSHVISGDNAYKMTVYGDSGREYEIILNVMYYNRSISQVYMATPEYSRDNRQGQEEFENYYTMHVDSMNTNVLYINPANSTLIRSGGYIFPNEIYVLYGNGESEKYVDVVWDTSSVAYSLGGTGDFISARILSYKLEKEVGYSIVSYDYDDLIISLTQYSDSNEVIGTPVRYSLDGTVDWNIKVFVEDMSVIALQDFGGSTTYGEVYTNTAVETLKGVIDCTSYKINQFYPEYPEELRLVFKDRSYETVDLKQSDWHVENGTELEYIVKGNATELAFTASFTYLGYKVSVRFGVYDNIDLRHLTQLGEYMDGGTIYLIQGQDSAENQIKKYYSVIYFNFGTTDEPDWKKVPLYIDTDGITANVIRTYRGNDNKGVRGTVGVSESNIIDNNILFTIEVVSPELFASLNNGLNDFVTYDYYCYAHDINNEISTSLIDSPPSMGSYFATSASSNVHFEIQESGIQYDFINGIAYVPVLYDMSAGSDSRIAMDEEGSAKFGITIRVPLRTYLNKEITQNAANNISFDKESANAKGWVWDDQRAALDAITWPLGTEMTASDLPKGKTQDTNFTFDFAWDLSNVNVNLATEEGYIVRGYYYTNSNRWYYKELTVYIDKINKSQDLISHINGSSGRYIGKTYDAKYFRLDFNADGLTFLRDDGTYANISPEDFYVEYRSADSTDDMWSSDRYPIDAGDYYIRIIMNDYNYYLRYADENGDEREYLTFFLTIDPMMIDISDIAFLWQEMDVTGSLTAGIATTYDGNRKNVVATGWFRSMTEREEMYESFYREMAEPNDITAKASVFERVYNRSSVAEKLYLDELFEITERNLSNNMPGWESYTEGKRREYCGANLYEKVLTQPVLPFVTVDNWFGEGEKDRMYTAFRTGNGSGEHSGVLYDEITAKALVYETMYGRVNQAAKRVMQGWYAEARRKLVSSATDTEVYAYVYTNYFPEVLVICEVALHFEYRDFNGYLDEAPIDVREGNYTVEVSVLPGENDGNYISSGVNQYGEERGGAAFIARTLVIAKDASIRYEIAEQALTYNGLVQNPNISPVTDSDGNLSLGVEIRYEYTIPQLEGVLVVKRTEEGGTTVDMTATTIDLSKYRYAGIKDIGNYNVKITVNGGINYYNMSDDAYKGDKVIEATIGILPADIFIEIEDINAYYLSDIVDLSEYTWIHNGKAEFSCDKCGTTLETYEVDDPQVGVYYLVCPNCQIRMAIDLTRERVTCYCPDCVADRDNGRQDGASMERSSFREGTKVYVAHCAHSNVDYTVTVNNNDLLGGESLKDIGELVASTAAKSFSPVGRYPIVIEGLRISGADGVYTYFDQTYENVHRTDRDPSERVMENRRKYGAYEQLKLQALSDENPNNLYAAGDTYASIIKMFANYNIFVKRSSVYNITTEDGAIGVSNDEQLADRLDALNDGDEAVIYLAPKTDNSGNALPYDPIVIDKDVNLTLVGYYQAGVDEKIFRTIISGITVRKGSLTLRIIEVRVPADGGRGLVVEKGVNTVRIEECLFSVGEGETNKDTCGIYTAVNYTEKINVLGGTRFEGLRNAIWLMGGGLEVNDCVFRNNAVGVQIVSVSNDINIQRTRMENHTDCAVNSTNSRAVILNNTFRYNRVAIRIPTVLNDDMYKNNFTENGVDTNATDIETE